MKYCIIISIMAFATQIVEAQRSALSKKMWEQVQTCYDRLEDVDEDGKKDWEELIDDSSNGYLKLSGTWPTCGCSCTATVAAFKSYSGNYTFLRKEQWGCDWINMLHNNVATDTLFPDFFQSKGFFSQPIENKKHRAYFFVDLALPRYGTNIE